MCVRPQTAPASRRSRDNANFCAALSRFPAYFQPRAQVGTRLSGLMDFGSVWHECRYIYVDPVTGTLFCTLSARRAWIIFMLRDWLWEKYLFICWRTRGVTRCGPNLVTPSVTPFDLSVPTDEYLFGDDLILDPKCLRQYLRSISADQKIKIKSLKFSSSLFFLVITNSGLIWLSLIFIFILLYTNKPNNRAPFFLLAIFSINYPIQFSQKIQNSWQMYIELGNAIWIFHKIFGFFCLRLTEWGFVWSTRCPFCSFDTFAIICTEFYLNCVICVSVSIKTIRIQKSILNKLKFNFI